MPRIQLSISRLLTVLSIILCLSTMYSAAGGSLDSRTDLEIRKLRSIHKSSGDLPSRPNSIIKTNSEMMNPLFELSGMKKKVTVLVGNSAYLHCRVHNIGAGIVSWIRQRDYTILTVDTYTYTSDVRFKAIHPDGSLDWTLQISYTKIEDEGIYECQVSTEKKISQAVNLEVSTAKARISGDSELHIKTGNTINLTCEITNTKTPPVYVFWYKDNDVINYDNLRSGISLSLQNLTLTTSNLRITEARVEDSGNYSCKPSFTEASSILVRVINVEETPAAMQYEKEGISSSSRPTFAISSVFLLLINSVKS